jgi:anaerobic ribonucleoside-triphosphate reductase activating protein
MHDFKINYGNIKTYDVGDGEGVRVSLFVSGCDFHCKECHNSEAWDYNYGNNFNQTTLNFLKHSISESYISGLSILGGEPLAPKNREDVFEIIREVKKEFPNKTIWLWSGYTFETIKEKNIIPIDVLNMIDVLVDGLFEIEKRDLSLKYRGSRNQRVIDIKKSLETDTIVNYCE